ncbi:MAG: Gfo/Idh/MocA family oxidoreductase [Acidobacteria bacterium]|nr:Gfo/Idh/MocA family oxidoreductase [Acidobacteriota bacterium]
MLDQTTRRFFLGALTAASSARVWGANDKVNVGIVGLGGRGSSHLNTYTGLAEAQVVALCDVNQAAREKAQATLVRKSLEKAAEFEDMRQMFADPKVEAVSIATPNHWHALSAIWAMKAGKDVYGEKPACYNIHEGMRMIQVQRETKRIMQVGSQHRSLPFKIKAIAALQQGLIGKLYMTKALCYKLRPSIGHTPDSPTPPGVNWDLFLGPAPMRPFNQKRFAYFWHWFWDTGNGDIGNQGVHETGIARWALGDPIWPKTAMAFGGKFGIDDDTETPNTLTAGFSYGNEQLVIEVRGKMTNGEGVRQARVVTAGPMAGPRGGGRPGGGPPPAGAPPDAPAPTQVGPAGNPLNVGVGNLFYGSDGWAAMSDQGFQAYKGDSSELVMEERPERGRGGDSTGLHMQNFLACVKSRQEKDLHDPISNAVPSANLCHLANISYRVGRVLKIEAGPVPKFTGDAEAAKMITRPVYRKPYEV